MLATSRTVRLALAALLLALGLAGQVSAQERPANIRAELVSDGVAVSGETLTLAIAFDPEPGWHGYWSNPGDAGQGMTVDWTLPDGWRAGPFRYPVPERLTVAGLMNHVFEGPYAVLVDVEVPADARPGTMRSIEANASYLACTDRICVPEQASLRTTVRVAERGGPEPRFAAWRAALPPAIDRTARFARTLDALRIAIPLPEAVALADPHVFVETLGAVRYGEVQSFARDGDTLIVSIPRADGARANAIDGVLSFGDGRGLAFSAEPGPVPSGDDDIALAPLWLLALGALAGGLMLNVLPCVFPILSLKALSLARAGGDERAARADALAYTAGVLIACLVLGGALLALRAGGEQVGWAFQLQQPGIVALLLVLAVAITANFAGLFELPGLSIARGGKPAGAFGTGLLAAFVATPCTGPFMAAALGAALVLPVGAALLLFAMLGMGLALPFLLLGFVPALRRRLPTPGPWMDRFRRWMALPMGLTALALVWLAWRVGGAGFAGAAMATALLSVALLWFVLNRRRSDRRAGTLLAGLAALALVAGFALPPLADDGSARDGASILVPEPFSAEALAAARAGDRPVFLWFTADWCVTCKVNERVAIEREAVRAAFEEAGVATLRGDWTRPDPAIASFIAERGAAGVPLYIWYEPGSESERLPQLLAPSDLIELAERPRGTATAARQ